MKNLLTCILSGAVMITGCTEQHQKNEDTSFPKGTLGYDLHFLNKHDSSLAELRSGDAVVVVSAKYQGKVFTSGAGGEEGPSYGWINYKAFSAPVDPHMNAYGGENRLWLGPEGGRYSLYFRKGDSMVFDNWKTPAAFDTEPWQVRTRDEKTVSLQKEMKLENYTGSVLDIMIDRSVSILTKDEIIEALSIQAQDSLRYVGYSTLNRMTNSGNAAWTEQTGMPCIWILDMFNPTPATTIVIPYKESTAGEKVATTDYFGEISKDRIKLTGKTLFFKADGKRRGKIGIVPAKVLPVAGSYDADSRLLTITKFSVDNTARYLNQEWTTSKPVFSGDAMNAYNDGPLDDGSQMGPFYEIESVSPAADLQPGASIMHKHDVYHFSGTEEALNSISQKVLGVTLSEIKNAFIERK